MLRISEEKLQSHLVTSKQSPPDNKRKYETRSVTALQNNLFAKNKCVKLTSLDQSEEKTPSLETTIPHKHYSSPSNKAALLIHGGCFIKGDETWNQQQAAGIAAASCVNVYTLDFDKTCLDKSFKDIKTFYEKLFRLYEGQVGLIGCSSGGFHALTILNEISQPTFVTLICPVMDPMQREDMILEMHPSTNSSNIQRDQLSYFKQRPYPTAAASEFPIHIIAAKKDENVPLELINKEIERYPNAKLHLLEGAHELSHKNNRDVNDIVASIVDKQLTTRLLK